MTEEQLKGREYQEVEQQFRDLISSTIKGKMPAFKKEYDKLYEIYDWLKILSELIASIETQYTVYDVKATCQIIQPELKRILADFAEVLVDKQDNFANNMADLLSKFFFDSAPLFVEIISKKNIKVEN